MFAVSCSHDIICVTVNVIYEGMESSLCMLDARDPCPVTVLLGIFVFISFHFILCLLTLEREGTREASM